MNAFAEHFISQIKKSDLENDAIKQTFTDVVYDNLKSIDDLLKKLVKSIMKSKFQEETNLEQESKEIAYRKEISKRLVEIILLGVKTSNKSLAVAVITKELVKDHVKIFLRKATKIYTALIIKKAMENIPDMLTNPDEQDLSNNE